MSKFWDWDSLYVRHFYHPCTKVKTNAQCFQLGPYHSSGKSYAQIINACASHRKHHEEWDQTSISQQAKNTLEVIETFNVDGWSEYPLSNIFYLLFDNKNEASFRKLLTYLNNWSNEIL